MWKLSLFNRSVAVRTTVFVLSVVTILMLVAGIMQISIIKKSVTEEAYRQANRSIDNAIKVIDNRIMCVETAVQTAAGYADMMAPDKILADTLIKRLLATNEDIAAVTLMYRADYFPKHGRYYAPTILRDEDSGDLRFDEIGGPEKNFCYLETDSNWVYSNLLDRGYWCLPYVDSMSTERSMVSYSVPLHDKRGDTYAVLCADIDLKWVQNVIDAAKPYDYSEAVVISRDSQFICHPLHELIHSVNAVKILEPYSKDIQKIASLMLQGERGFTKVKRPQVATDINKYSSDIVFYAPIDRVRWSLCFCIPEAKVLEEPNRFRNNVIIFFLIMSVTISLFLWYIIRFQLKPLKILAGSTTKVALGDFHVALPVIKTHDEIRELRDSFENMQISLEQYIDKLQKTTASKAMIDSELHVATDIQMSMLPTENDFKQMPDTLYGTLTPAKAVGGDLYDFFYRDNLLYFCIGDVSGKGVPASLLMAVTRALFHTIANRESSPARIVAQLNEEVGRSNTSNMFVTLFVGVLDLTTGHLQYCNAGHDAPLLITDNKQQAFLNCDSNIPVGVAPDWRFSEQSTVLAPATTIFLFTDGLTEAENIHHEQFHEERISDVASHADARPQSLIAAMTAAVREFVGEAEQSDDLTMLAIRYK